jgi:hypothetical protein
MIIQIFVLLDNLEGDKMIPLALSKLPVTPLPPQICRYIQVCARVCKIVYVPMRDEHVWTFDTGARVTQVDPCCRPRLSSELVPTTDGEVQDWKTFVSGIIDG